MSPPEAGTAWPTPRGCTFEQQLPAIPAAVAIARATAQVACRVWRLSALCEAVVLAVSELVTNGVRAGAKQVTLRLVLTQQHLRLEVSDDQPGVPQVRLPPTEAESGRGLWLVSTVATRFGVDRDSTGKTVWAEFAR